MVVHQGHVLGVVVEQVLGGVGAQQEVLVHKLFHSCALLFLENENSETQGKGPERQAPFLSPQAKQSFAAKSFLSVPFFFKRKERP